MAKVLDLKESIYKIITDYAKQEGITRATAKNIARLGFSSAVSSEDGTVYTDEVIDSLVAAYNNGVRKQDFSEFLSIIAHKEADMDKRSDGDFESVFRKIAPNKSIMDISGKQGNRPENYNDKAKALSSISSTHFFNRGKLAKMIKKGTVVQADFWQLMATANHTQTLMEEATPYLDSLRGAQKELSRGANGLKNEKDLKSYNNIMSFLKRVGVAVNETSLQEQDVDDITLQDVIGGKLAKDYLKTEIQRQQDEASEQEEGTIDADIRISKDTFYKKSRFPDEGHLSNSAIRAQMLAGKQTYSVLVAPIVKKSLGLLNVGAREGFQTGNMSGEDRAILDNILPLSEKERLEDVIQRVDGYADYLYGLIHPDENQDLKSESYMTPQGEKVTKGEMYDQHMKEWLLLKFDRNPEVRHSNEEISKILSRGLCSITENLNKSCILNGTYAEATTEDFLKSLIKSTSSESLGIKPDLKELVGQDDSGPIYRPFVNDQSNPKFSTNEHKLFLPLTLVTDYGAYETLVEYTSDVHRIANNREKLLETAIEQIGGCKEKGIKPSNPEANLRHLTTDNLVIGTNPIMMQVMDKYVKEQTPEGEIKTSKNNDPLTSKRNRQESLPLLYRDLQLYQQYKQQAAQSVKGFIFMPIGSAIRNASLEALREEGQDLPDPEPIEPHFNPPQPQQDDDQSGEQGGEQEDSPGENIPLGTEPPSAEEDQGFDAESILNHNIGEGAEEQDEEDPFADYQFSQSGQPEGEEQEGFDPENIMGWNIRHPQGEDNDQGMEPV